MNLLVVGVSYRTANVTLLERLAAAPPDAPNLLTDLLSQAYVNEAMVLSTCNRVEVYAGVTAFHGGLADIGAVLAARAGCEPRRTSTYISMRMPPGTRSGSPPASTRWSSAKRRYSGSSVPHTPSRPNVTRPAGSCTT